MSDAKPNINVTPLIDVLLVLLIIFMIIAPTKPSAFQAKIPQEPQEMTEKLKEHPDALIVRINNDSSLTLNQENNLGTISEPEKMMRKLSEVFLIRAQIGIYDEKLVAREDLRNEEKIMKTVFIKAPKKFAYGEVAKVVDAIKQTGANPVGLQVDDLE